MINDPEPIEFHVTPRAAAWIAIAWVVSIGCVLWFIWP